MVGVHFAESKGAGSLDTNSPRRATIAPFGPPLTTPVPQLCLHFITVCAELGTGLVASHEADVACESGKPGNQQVAPFLVFYI